MPTSLEQLNGKTVTRFRYEHRSAGEPFEFRKTRSPNVTLSIQRYLYKPGGAHPVARKPINDEFFVQVPIGQIRDPVDHGDFEGVGVKPDIESPSIRALPLAHRLALENLAKTDDAKRTALAWLLPTLTAESERPQIDAGLLPRAVGNYEGRQIFMDKGTLFYIWRDRLRVALTPIGPNLFAVEGVSNFRYRLETVHGNVTALQRVNQDGAIQTYKRLD